MPLSAVDKNETQLVTPPNAISDVAGLLVTPTFKMPNISFLAALLAETGSVAVLHMANMETHLCGTTLTPKRLGDLLVTSPRAQLKSNTLIDANANIVGDGRGFTSKVLRVQLDWNDPSNALQSVIVKVIGSTAMKDAFQSHFTEETMSTIQDNLHQAHNVECKVYQLEGLKRVVPMPDCYANTLTVGKEGGLIVLRDLSENGAVLPLTSWGIGLTPGQLDQVLDALSSAHAWSVNDTSWRREIPSLEEANAAAPLYDSLISLFPQSKAAFPDVFQNLDEEKVKENFNNDKFLELFGGDPKARYNLPLVLVHGDVHIMNMIFEKNADDSVGDKLLGLIDWQLAHQGCAMEDIARIMYLCLSTKTRKEEGDKILRKYVELFNSKVKNAEDRVSFQDCKPALDQMFAYMAIMWNCSIVMFTSWDGMLKDMPQEEKDVMKNRLIDSNIRSLGDGLEFYGWQ